MAEHGTYNRYANERCRCEPCRAAASAYQRDYKRRLRERVERGEVAIPHGTSNGYSNYGCRCEPCREAAGRIHRRAKSVRKAKMANGELAIPHGTLTGYADAGCRCDPCGEAMRAYRNAKALERIKTVKLRLAPDGTVVGAEAKGPLTEAQIAVLNRLVKGAMA